MTKKPTQRVPPAYVDALRIIRVLLDTPEEHRTAALAMACRVYCNPEGWAELEKRHVERLKEESHAK